MSRSTNSHSQGAHVAFYAQANLQTCVERSALFRRGSRDFIDRQKTDQSSALLEIRSAGDVFMSQHHLDLATLTQGRLHGDVGRKNIAAVVQKNQERAGTAG